MKKIFNLEDHRGNYDAMMCSSREESDYFRKFLHEHGRKWSSGDSYINKGFYRDGDTEFIYAFNSGLQGRGLNNHLQMGYNVLVFSDFDWPGFIDPFADYEPSESLNEFLGLFTNAMR